MCGQPGFGGLPGGSGLVSAQPCLANLRSIRQKHRVPVPGLGHPDLFRRGVAIVGKQETAEAQMEHRIIRMACDRPLILGHGVVGILVRRLCTPGKVEELFRVIQLIREGSLLQPAEHVVGKPPAIISGKRQQSVTFRFRRRLRCLSSFRKLGAISANIARARQVVSLPASCVHVHRSDPCR